MSGSNVIYLHGFSSGPSSKKVGMFAARFAEKGVNFQAPDLNVPDFEHLMLTAMIQRTLEVVRACPPGPVYLIGSSMGGAVALHLVDRFGKDLAARVEKLLLLAPAFDFPANRNRQLGEAGMDEWQREGWLWVQHYHYNQRRRVHYGLVEDALKYDSFATQVKIPILIFHGRHDESVDYRQSEKFAEGRPNVTLRVVESDHQLLDQVDTMWTEALTFFGI